MKILAALLCFFSLNAFAEGEAFSDLAKAVSKKTVERMGGGVPKVTSQNAVKGNQTGGSCKLAGDCVEGIKAGEKDVTCIASKEGTPAQGAPGGLKCTCLTSVFACGYAN